MMNKLYAKAQNKMETYKGYVNNEEGAQALEWIALGTVVIAVMAAIATGVSGNASGLGQAIIGKLSQLISSIN
ncbi:hypothetical protein ABE41_002880 [Fictibacillus arsenicus]|uniref:Uncharacterized protein n=1 Tax=Fictibacillus arsenicus TaxID=255247 RepID=A0A1B1Z0G1_9BACL|nr:hypothetical protein [Fictibacillus arsenicus]ANX10957.1 hypothetical protein ABE41_002880 [Fictibacillus arsenicus]